MAVLQIGILLFLSGSDPLGAQQLFFWLYLIRRTAFYSIVHQMINKGRKKISILMGSIQIEIFSHFATPV
jgi:hypothetical protein